MDDIIFHTACFPLSMLGTNAAKPLSTCGWLKAYLKPHFFCKSLWQFVVASILIARVWYCYCDVLLGHHCETGRFPL